MMDEQQADQLRKLAALRSDGLLTEDEFAAKKQAILGITAPAPATAPEAVADAEWWQSPHAHYVWATLGIIVVITLGWVGLPSELGGGRISKSDLEASIKESDLASLDGGAYRFTGELTDVSCISQENDGSQWKCLGAYSGTDVNAESADLSRGPASMKVTWTVTVDTDGSWVAEPTS